MTRVKTTRRLLEGPNAEKQAVLRRCGKPNRLILQKNASLFARAVNIGRTFLRVTTGGLLCADHNTNNQQRRVSCSAQQAQHDDDGEDLITFDGSPTQSHHHHLPAAAAAPSHSRRIDIHSLRLSQHTRGTRLSGRLLFSPSSVSSRAFHSAQSNQSWFDECMGEGATEGEGAAEGDEGSADEDKGDSCRLCWARLTEEAFHWTEDTTLFTLECGHTFHTACLKEKTSRRETMRRQLCDVCYAPISATDKLTIAKQFKQVDKAARAKHKRPPK
ncbi:unnamed protein product [Vitrella brassicaformis CCMP3155]|uniref:RING-type domain-containing protein n=1 Tax=Vitrella brassicaformis (strain CCMP3155) TaxID=1169540 RepID=A0A0G4F3S9_VITBC|nr:unnamed protein product [Vitrella brassicaformis CCMP3155]|eukprot:CEM06495.1 unnamed protein product [Vitrella brassicaformis CCMP3155]